MIRIREARPVRDVLGVVLVATTALLYAAERQQRAAAAEGPPEAAVVVESTEGADLSPAPAALESATAAPVPRVHGQG